jgi:hypothetical protein
VIAAVENPRVEIYTGKDDQVLRRMVVDLGVDDQRSGTRATVALDVSITDLNEDQDIAEPADAKPFSELLGQLGGLGLGGAAGGGSSDPAPSGGAPRRSSRGTRSASPTPGRTSRKHESALTC